MKRKVNFDMHFERNISPLRYPGSKQNLIPYIERILVHNCLSPDILVEPFVGGGSVFLSLITRGIAEEAIISDYDPLLYSFWSTVFSEPHLLIEFVEHVHVDLKTFYKYKKVSKNPKSFNKNQLAKACLFLNRTSFSGIIAPSAGPIGGSRQESEYKIDCRFNRSAIISKIEYISAFQDQVTILPYDWQKAVSHSLKKYSKGKVLFYFDPPFYHKAKDLYRTFFAKPQHEKLAAFLHKFPHNWVLSYDNAPEIRKLYSGHKGQSLHVEIPYSINSQCKRIANELIISPLKVPHTFVVNVEEGSPVKSVSFR